MTGRTILLVEDSSHIRDAFTLLLEDSGYVVRTAGTGAEAIQCASESLPDLILLDLGLPDMAGLDVARSIHRVPGAEQVRIVALTGHALDADRAAALAAGCAGYLTKPIGASTLLDALPGFFAA